MLVAALLFAATLLSAAEPDVTRTILAETGIKGGLIAAAGRLHWSTTDGKLVCTGSRPAGAAKAAGQ